MNDLIEALQIFLKYGNPRNPTYCQYDTLYITEIEAKDVSGADKMRLEELGFFEDTEDGGFMSFRYGSS